MKLFSRREFCSLTGTIGGVALLSPGHLISQADTVSATVKVDFSTSLQTVPSDFMGLSYESGQLAYPDFFSPHNIALIQMFRTLCPHGVLRLGGNLSEFTTWSATEPTPAPEPNGLVGPDPGHRVPRTFTISPKSIRNLHGFLTAAGWRCIYGLNLGGGSVEKALEEGNFVARTLGSQLICVQFGNEPDLFKHHDQDEKPWTFDEYLEKWKVFRGAFHQKLPHVPVAGPDTAFNQKWVKQFTDTESKEVTFITSHYYPLGPPTDPHMTIDLLLHPGARFDSSCKEAIQSAHAAGLPFRMTEVNSCYNAGKPGVSDAFASTLWAADFCLQMATLGCIGVNLHGGANGYYSPIVGSIDSGFTIKPEYYGLLLAQRFAGSTLVHTAIDAQGANVTAYASHDGSAKWLAAVINKDSRQANVALSGFPGSASQAIVERLKAPSIDSKTNVTFDNASIAGDGLFHPQPGETVEIRDSKTSVSVPAYSAALIRLS